MVQLPGVCAEDSAVVRQVAHDLDLEGASSRGVSKFAKTSIFSAFNNPVDLTLEACVADVVGYTHEEMETYFHEHIQAFADKNGLTYEGGAFGELLRRYDNYQFAPERLVRVINPVSLGRALSNGVIRNYWEATAGSTLIFDTLTPQVPNTDAVRLKTHPNTDLV